MNFEKNNNTQLESSESNIQKESVLLSEKQNNRDKISEQELLDLKNKDEEYTNNELTKIRESIDNNDLEENQEQEDDPEMMEIIGEMSGVEAYANPASQPELFLSSYENRVATVFRDVFNRLYPGDKHFELSDKERIKNKVEQKISEIYDKKLPGFAQQYSAISNLYNEKLKKLRQIEEGLNPFADEIKLQEKVREDYLSAINNGNPRNLSEEEINNLYKNYHELDEKIRSSDFVALKEKAWKERVALPEKKEKELISMIKDLSNMEKKYSIEKDISQTEKVIDPEYLETLLLGRKLQDFPKDVQEKYKASVEKYSQGLADAMKEEDENGLTSVDKIKNIVRTDYNKIMNKLGILSSSAGASDNWIYWDLGKQSYLAKHPEESNGNYKLLSPFSGQNEQVLKDIINRHVGWEFLGYIKNNPGFTNSLNQSKDSYLKIISLINEEKQLGTLSSYKLSELGQLAQENML